MPKQKQCPEPAVIEIVDKGSVSDGGVKLCVPNSIWINGIEVLVPADAEVEIGRLSHEQPVTVRLTMFAREVSIRRAADSGHDVPGRTGTPVDGVLNFEDRSA